MVLWHVSWVPQAFTWNSGWTVWSKMNFRMLLWLDDLHLGSSWYSSGFIMYEWTHEFMGNKQSMSFSTYIRKLLSQIFLGTGAGEIKWCHTPIFDLRCHQHVPFKLHSYAIRLWFSVKISAESYFKISHFWFRVGPSSLNFYF